MNTQTQTQKITLLNPYSSQACADANAAYTALLIKEEAAFEALSNAVAS